MKLSILDKSISNKKTFIVLIIFSFSIFIFTSDGHRTSFDEDVHQLGTLRLVTLEPHPLFVEGDSKMLFEWPSQFPNPVGAICQNELLCSQGRIGQNILQYPFVFLSYKQYHHEQLDPDLLYIKWYHLYKQNAKLFL